MFHQASMLFSAFVMAMGAGWYGLQSHSEDLQVRETVETASQAAELSAAVSEQIEAVQEIVEPSVDGE